MTTNYCRLLFGLIIVATQGLAGSVGRIPLVFAQVPKQERAKSAFQVRVPGFHAHFGANEILLGSRKTKVRVTFPNANPDVEPQGVNKLGARVNYLLGEQRSSWQTNLSLFQSIQYSDLYSGVDLIYMTADGLLKSEFHLKPGADASRIAMRFEAESEVTINENGSLVVSTAQGSFEEQAPVSYQNIGQSKMIIGSRYVRRSINVIGIELDEYDHDQPLIIDPVLTFSSFLGGSGGDSITSMAIASDNTIYVAGFTDAPDFPTVTPRQSASGGGVDGFVIHLSSNGSTILYSTYLGGRGDDRITSIKVDSSGKVFVAGCTTSSNFPTLLARQPALSGSKDAFLSGISANGQSLIFSTYLGGSSSECANGLALDGRGGVVIGGETTSSNFPVLSAYQATSSGGSEGFIAKFTDTGTLVFSTYFGGSGDDRILGMALDSSSNIYLTGSTTSSNFPTMTPFQSALAGGMDAFVTKLNATGTALLYSTYLGGSAGSGSLPEAGYAIAIGAAGNAYVAGVTYSSNFPTAAPVQSYGGQGDGFVARLNTAGTGLDYSTYLGGSGLDMVLAIVVDADGGCQVAGSTQSSNLAVVNSFQPSRGGATDALFGQFNANGTLKALSYFGGSDMDAALAIATDSTFRTYFAGQTASANLPLRNPLQSFSVGSSSAFLVRVTDPPKIVSVTPASSTGASKTFTFVASAIPNASSIGSVAILINNSLIGSNACYLIYNQSQNTIALANDSGTAFPSALAGSSTELSNSQCSVPAAQVAVAASGQTLTIIAKINFKAAFDGPKNIYMLGVDASSVSGVWANMGTFRVAATPVAPTVSATPTSGSGLTSTFQFTFSDVNGVSDITTTFIVIGSILYPTNTCYIAYYVPTNLIYLANDSGTAWTNQTASQNGTLQNSQCRLQMTSTSVTVTDTSVVLTLKITFSGSFSGLKSIWVYAQDAGPLTAGYQTLGSWSVLNSAPTVSVSPTTGAGSSGTFQFVFSDLDGSNTLSFGLVVINSKLAPNNSCYFAYNRVSNVFALIDDAGTGVTSLLTPQSGVLQNSQCRIQVEINSITTTSTSVILTVPITFEPSYAGAKNIYMYAIDTDGLSLGYKLVGTFVSP